MASTVIERFMEQQGFAREDPASQRRHFRALLFQPLVVGPLMLLGVLLQLRWLFFALAAVLAWNVAFPQWNPFEWVYHRALSRPQGLPPLEPAPSPRRFAQGMAAVFMLAAGLAISWGWWTAAYAIEALLVAAFAALLGGKFCLGAYLYRLLRGQAAFANATCPWAR